MKVLIITSERIKQFPPMYTMLSILKELGCEITVITPAYDPSCASINGINCLWVQNRYIETIEDKKMSRIQASVAYRLNIAQKFLCLHLMPILFKETLNKSDIVWVLHEKTALYGGKFLFHKLKPYLYTMYELRFDLYKNKRIFEYAAQKAKLMIAPEYCRAHIMKAIYNLSTLPYVIPNKPFDKNELDQEIDSNVADANASLQNIIDSGRKIIMYMGIISPERPLEPLIDAIAKIRDEYEFVVVGMQTQYLKQILSKKGDLFTYLGFFSPPHHLQIAQKAHIAYVGYVPQNTSINAVFCAPNKIYEFAKYGIPLLCNDVPGLKYQVEINGFGTCVNDFSNNTIIDAVKFIENHYEQMSASAKEFYKALDLKNIYRKLIDRFYENDFK